MQTAKPRFDAVSLRGSVCAVEVRASHEAVPSTACLVSGASPGLTLGKAGFRFLPRCRDRYRCDSTVISLDMTRETGTFVPTSQELCVAHAGKSQTGGDFWSGSGTYASVPGGTAGVAVDSDTRNRDVRGSREEK